MIELRRAFLNACGLTALVLLLLTACDMGATTAEVSPTAAPSVPATSPAIPTPSVSPTVSPAVSIEPVATVPQGGALPIRLSADIPELRPWDLRSRGEEHVADLLYNGLTRLDPRLQPQPDLAESWTVSPDGGLITFTLQSNIQWHDGQPLTSEDVAWTLNTLRTITSTNALLYDLRSYVGDVQAPLENTVVISLTEPYAPLLANLAVPILPRHLLADRSPEQLAALNFWDQPIGTGPFKLEDRKANQSISFTRNDEYFRTAPHLDEVVLVIAPDDGVAAAALQNDQLLVAEFPGVTEPFSNTTEAESFRTGAYPENGWYGVVFNTRPERLFADGRLRNALGRAVNVDQVVQSATGGAGQPIVTTLSRVSAAYPSDLAVLPPDLDGARQLLDEAGWTPGEGGVRQKDGRPLAARLLVRGDDPRRVTAAQQIAEAAATIGMQIDVVPADFNSVILPKLAPPYDFDLLLGSWVNAPNSVSFPTSRFYDPDDFGLFHSSRIWRGEGDTRGGLRNVGGFNNTEYDQAAENARRAYDVAERQQAIQAAQTVLIRERPYLLLWADRIPVVLDARVASTDGEIALDTPRYLWNVEQWYITP